MNKSLISSHSILINSTPEKVWEVLTHPDKIALYLYGTRTETDWKMGSPIRFSGEYEGHQYSDKGIVMANVPLKLLAYDYWSQFSGLDDIPENYCEVSYHLEAQNGCIKFTWQQIGFKDEQALAHNNSSMPSLLKYIKKIAELS